MNFWDYFVMDSLSDKNISYNYIPTSTGKTWSCFYAADHAKAIVILPNGSGEFRSVFYGDTCDEQVDWLKNNNLSVLKYDKYGCGESEGDWKQVTMDILVNQLRDISMYVKSTYSLPVVFMGHSEGSIISAEAAKDNSAVDLLVLRVASHQDIKSRLKFQLNKSDPSGVSYQKWINGIHKIENLLEKDKKVEGFLSGHPCTYWASRLGRNLTGDVLKSVTVPTFALNGADDFFTPHSSFEMIHRALDSHVENSLSKEYEGVGHSLRKQRASYADSEAHQDIIKWINNLID